MGFVGFGVFIFKTNSQNTKASKNLFCLTNKMFGHFLQVVQPRVWSQNEILRTDALPLIKGPYKCFNVFANLIHRSGFWGELSLLIEKKNLFLNSQDNLT